MGKSYLVPIFFISLGARLTTSLRGGRDKQQFLKVDLILSLASLIAKSGNPIISIFGSPLL